MLKFPESRPLRMRIVYNRMTRLPDKYVLNRCSQCGEIFTKENMIEYETVWVCANCKPVFFQKLKEGVEIVPKAANMIGWKIFFFVYLVLSIYSSTRKNC